MVLAKRRYNNQTASFGNKSREKNGELSKYIRELKRNSINYDLNWSIACKSNTYTGGTTKCDLCFTEKLVIMKADPASLLNRCDRLVSKCKHINKFTFHIEVLN